MSDRKPRADAPATVLVVDDSLGQRLLLSRILERHGFCVFSAGSGQAALDIAATERPDVVLCDWMMPGMSGLELCGALRRQSRARFSYFILLTSKDQKQDVAHGLDAGADDFLTKPVSQNELLARIRAGQRIVSIQRELSKKNRMISATLDEMRELHLKLDHDLLEARKLQQSLVPERHASFGDFAVSLALLPAGRVGGDLVGMFGVNEAEFCVFAIDVSGHGIASALMTARIAGYLSGARPNHNVAISSTSDGSPTMRSPSDVARRLNTIVTEEMETDQYFTMALARVNIRNGAVDFVQAGHPHPALQDADGSVRFVGEGGLPIGLIPDAYYVETRITLSPGSRLFIASDGITECMNPGGELLGEAGLAKTLRVEHATEGQAVFDNVREHLVQFSEKPDLDDDVSAALIKRQAHA